MLRALCTWQRWIGLSLPKVARIALESALAPSTMNSRADGRVETSAIHQIVEKRLHDSGVLGRPFDQGERMFVAFAINAEGGDQHQVVADVQPVDLDDQEVQLGQVGAPSTRPAVRPTAPRTGARPPTSRCRPRQ